MKKIEMLKRESKNFLEVFEMFVISQAAKGVADITIRNYRYHMKNMSNYFDAEKPFDEVTKRDMPLFESGIVLEADCGNTPRHP